MYRSDVFVGRRNRFYGIGVFWIGERGEFLVVVVSLLVLFCVLMDLLCSK